MSLSVKKSVLISHGYWGRGGAEVATMHLIEALKNKYDVYLITRGGWNLNQLNNVAGTQIIESDYTHINLPFSKIFSLTTAGAIWHALFLRYCRYISIRYNICITASRVQGWGVPAIHFLSDIVWNKDLQTKYGENSIKYNFLRTLLFSVGQFIAGRASYELNSKDLFIANSNWTAEISKPYTIKPPTVIYPVVNSDFDQIPWHNKRNEFVCFGRISPEKKIEDAITIIEGVRKLGFSIELTIYGQFDDSTYSKSLKDIISNKEWIKTPGPIYGNEKRDVLPTFKYGINTCQREAFGISTAEMMKAGIIPFAPTQGAQKEITDCTQITFDGIDDAVEKIATILRSSDLQTEICTHLNSRKHLFSAEEYNISILNLLSNL